MTLRIGSRGSALARWQAEHVRDRLLAAHPGLAVEMIIITTEGDVVQDRPLHAIGGKGLFVKAIEERLQAREIDLAVHSMKDMPAVGPADLVVACTPAREDPRDAVVAPPGTDLATLPAGARVGTGSLRRGALVRRLAPQVEVVPIRGNVPTRVGRVDDGSCTAVILAAAGLARLGLSHRVAQWLDPETFCPAPAQGILALQCRADDASTIAAVAPLRDAQATIAAAAERAFLRRLQAGCTVPVGAYARREGDTLIVRGLVVHESGEPCYEAVVRGAVGEAEALGDRVAGVLLDQGAGDIVGLEG